MPMHIMKGDSYDGFFYKVSFCILILTLYAYSIETESKVCCLVVTTVIFKVLQAISYKRINYKWKFIVFHSNPDHIITPVKPQQNL